MTFFLQKKKKGIQERVSSWTGISVVYGSLESLTSTRTIYLHLYILIRFIKKSVKNNRNYIDL